MEKKILIVDDHPDSRQICTAILRHHGYATVEAEDGPTAIARAIEEQPDAVILDLELPGRSGLA